MSSSSRANNILDLQRLAAKALPLPIRHYMEGAADDEWTLRRNTAAFDEWTLTPRSLVDVANIDTATTLLGCRSSLPLFLSPTGMSQLFHSSGEASVARAALAEDVPYSLSTLATTSIEAIADTGATRFFQLYLFRDRGLTGALLERAWESGFSAILLTSDTAVGGNRERDRRTGMVIPPRFTARSIASFALHPAWSLRALRSPSFQLANVSDLSRSGISVMDYINQQFDPSSTWEGLEWLRSQWPGKLVVKGLMAPDDCERAAESGADAVMISNHGGRQLDGAAAPIDCLPAIRDRVQDRIQLIVDGGVRRGTHVLKALALGADGCSIGRAYLYGLAAGGEAGVRRVLAIFRSEIERDMALLGRTRVADICADDIRHLAEFKRR